MNSKRILAVLLMIPGVGFSQGAALESEVDSELEQLYSQQLPEKSVRPSSPMVAQPVQSNTAQPIYILNQAPQTPAVSVQKQPTTLVEASPLVESRADQMRKTRVDAEAQTETKIVEKLEQSRLDDEKRRADVLFGGKFEQLSNKPSDVVEPVHVAPAPVQMVAPPVQIIQAPPAQAPHVDVETKDHLTREAVREELESVLKAEQDAVVTPVEQKYFSAMVGFPDYPDSTNVRGNYSLGASFGTKYDEVYAVEGTFIFSNYTMNPIYRDGYPAPDMDVNQYSGSIGMKYFLFSGMVRPFVGGLGQYTYRTYQWSDSYYVNYSASETSTNSHSIDLGLNVGADVVFNPRLTVGFDYRYFFNLSSRKNSSSFVYQPFYGTALEQLNSSLVSVSAKVQF